MGIVEAIRPLNPNHRVFLSFPLDDTTQVPEILVAFNHKPSNSSYEKPYTMRFVPVREAATELSNWPDYYPLHAAELFNGKFEAIAIARPYEYGAAVNPGYFTETNMEQSTFFDMLKIARNAIHEEYLWFYRDCCAGKEVSSLVTQHQRALFTASNNNWLIQPLRYDDFPRHWSRPPVIPDELVIEKRDGIERLLAA